LLGGHPVELCGSMALLMQMSTIRPTLMCTDFKCNVGSHLPHGNGIVKQISHFPNIPASGVGSLAPALLVANIGFYARRNSKRRSTASNAQLAGNPQVQQVCLSSDNAANSRCRRVPLASQSVSTGSKEIAPLKKFLVGANWKCGLDDVNSVDDFICEVNHKWTSNGKSVSDVEVFVYPPYIFIDRVRQKLIPEIHVGSQNVWDAAPGFNCTGGVSAAMVKSIGCKWVLLGHSDRRNVLGETNELIGEKVKRCLESGLCVNLTIGETLAIREAGNAMSELLSQLKVATAAVPEDAWGCIAVAYEPVWAIGDGATPCSPEETQRVHAGLRAWIAENVSEAAAKKCRLLYTGSVNEENAASYACLPDVDGFPSPLVTKIR